MLFQEQPTANVTTVSKTQKSKNWPKILPRSKKHQHHPNKPSNVPPSTANNHTLSDQKSSDSPPPRPPPPLSRKGSSANDRMNQELHLPTDEISSPLAMDSHKVRNILNV